MKPMQTWARVESALLSNQLSALIGLAEDLHFEAKSAAGYDLTSLSGQYELAKDVSGLANSEGGWLLVGLVTHRPTAEAVDEVASLDLISESDFLGRQITGLLREYLQPSIAGLDVYWCADAADTSLGVGVIYVPRQSDDRKPFLIAKVSEDGERLKQIVFGYTQRLGGDVVPYSAAQMQNAMKQGMNSTAQRLTSLEEKLNVLLEREYDTREVIQNQSLADLHNAFDQRVKQLINSDGPTHPFFVIAGAVPMGNRLRGFFKNEEDSPFWLLSAPERFRGAGFDVSTPNMARLVDGEYWEVRSGTRKVLRLYSDGMALFRMRADQEFLAWGQNAFAFDEYVRLNPVPVVESQTSFVHLYAKIVKMLLDEPISIYFFLRFSNAQVNGLRLALSEYYPEGMDRGFAPTAYPVHTLDAADEVQVTADELRTAPDVVAYRIIAAFYRMCDAEYSLIPFTTSIDGSTSIDVDAIRQL